MMAPAMIPYVLLVDDDPNDEELARIALSHANVPHRLEVARDGPEALDVLFGRGNMDGSMPDVPHLILLDLKLPKMTGLEVLAKIRGTERTRLVPVVVFTSSLEETDLLESYRLGANGYIRKPVDYREYKALIADVGSFWIRRNQTVHTLSPAASRW